MRPSVTRKIYRIPLIVGFSIFFVISLIFLILSFSILKEEVPENYVEVEATIVEIKETFIRNYGEDEYQYEVFISYSYGEEEFPYVSYNKYNSFMKKGDKVVIFVDPDTPSLYMSDPSDNFLFSLISGIFVIAGAVGIIVNVKKYNEGKEEIN